MTKHRAPRQRRDHPGVKLRRLSDGRYAIRWLDPLTGRECQQSLDKLGLTSAEARLRFAVQKSIALLADRAAIAVGGAAAERVLLPQAVTSFLAGYTKELTVDNYATVLARFTAWATDNGIGDVQDINRALLAKYRDWVRQDPVSRSSKGGKRGAKRQTARRRSPATVNKVLMVTKVFLGWARRRGWTPHLTSDAISDALLPVKMPRQAIDYLDTDAVKTLLQAALRHDADRFTMTRDEHDGLRNKGTTPRNQPIAPFVLSVLLTGCRFMEAAGLVWGEVDLAAKVIRLPAERVKTGHARTITMTETPTLVSLLQALRVRGGSEDVFGMMTRDRAETARYRLIHRYCAPTFTWHGLRRTAGTLLTNAPGIYGGASAFMSAKRLGHSVTIAERHYVGTLPGLPVKATSLEAAAGVEDLARKVVASVGALVDEASAATAAG